MSGSIVCSKIQFGREASVGGEVDAVSILRVEGALLEPMDDIQSIPENVGLLVPTDRMAIPSKAAGLSIPDNNLTFEQVLHILEMGVKTVDGVQDGTGSGYVYTYNLPTTAQLTPKTYTIEGGDDQQAMLVTGVFAEEFSISGKVKEALKFSASLFGRTADNTTFTNGLQIPVVEEMLFQKCKFYLNDASLGFGATLISNTLLGFNLSVKTGYVARFTSGGTLYYAYIKQTQPEYTLELTFEHNTTAEAEVTKGRALTPRLARILCEGTALVDADTYTYKSFIIDLAGKYVKIPKIDDEDGNSIMTFSIKGGYNSTVSTMGKFVVVNEIDSWADIIS